MTPFERSLLQKIMAHERERAERDPKPYEWGSGGIGYARIREGNRRIMAVQVAQHGPRICTLYPPGAGNTERRRVSRALAKLEDAGLVELWGDGVNKTHCKLTPAGWIEVLGKGK
jgi:hypothetical protein